MTELELIFNYYKQKQIEENELKSSDDYDFNNNYELDFANNLNNAGNKLYYLLSDLRGFGGFPSVISDEMFKSRDNLGDGKSFVFHGFSEFEHGANYLWDFYYHYGEGYYGSGLYFTDNFSDAFYYTKNDEGVSKDRVLKAFINSDNFICYTDLSRLEQCILNRCLLNEPGEYIPLVKDESEYVSQEQMEKHIELEEKRAVMFENLIKYLNENFNEEERHELVNEIATNPSILAVYLGFDYMTRKNYHGDESNHFVVYNRKIIEVSESEFEKFMDNSGENYKGLRYERK